MGFEMVSTFNSRALILNTPWSNRFHVYGLFIDIQPDKVYASHCIEGSIEKIQTTYIAWSISRR